MREDLPAVYLLVGPDGPAKAAYVRVLVGYGLVAVPAGSPTQVADTLAAHVLAGRDTLLAREHLAAGERDHLQALVEKHGGQWCMITFSTDHQPLAAQLPGTRGA